MRQIIGKFMRGCMQYFAIRAIVESVSSHQLFRRFVASSDHVWRSLPICLAALRPF
jgi:hypothetical protein